MSIELIETVAKRYKTKRPEITKIIIGNKNAETGIIIAERIYYEVDTEGKKLIAIDWMSALASLYDYEESDKK